MNQYVPTNRFATIVLYVKDLFRNRRPLGTGDRGAESLSELFDSLVREAAERGVGEDVIASAFNSAVQSAALVVADRLQADAPRMLRDQKIIRDGFERRLRQRWGRALDLYQCVYVCCLESGEGFQAKHGAQAQHDEDPKFGALILLHGRACMVASEINGLLRTGHAAGAQARWRTLHEIAVVAAVLAAADREISERFQLHRYVERYKDARLYQQYCEALGYEKFGEEKMEEMHRGSDEVVERYGADYKRDWGWAKPLFPENVRPDFAALEKLAGFEHLRPWYRLANHGVHSGATGAAHVFDFYGQGQAMLAGPSNFGLADPANGAMIALYQVTTSLLIFGTSEPPSAEDVVCIKAIDILLDRAQQAFFDIHAALEREEAAIQAQRNEATNP
jgi:Family of unknown function (DUF5677)